MRGTHSRSTMVHPSSSDHIILGLGSHHGDDQAGWLVIDELCQLGFTNAFRITDAARLLDYLPDRSLVVIVDACQSGAPVSTIHRSVWPDERIDAWRGHSTHSSDVPMILETAQALGVLPRKVLIYGIEAENCRPGADLCDAVRRSALLVAQMIGDEVNHAIRTSHA